MQKLNIDLIPKNAWGKNVRAVVSSLEWSILRWRFGASLEKPISNNGVLCGKSYRGNDYLLCGVCEGKFENLHLHELWRFDDVTLVQKLIGCQPICEECHNAIHYGRSSVVGLEDQAYAHIKKVNCWTDSQVKDHITESLKQWARRNKLHYKMDLSFLIDNKIISERKIHWQWLNRPIKVHDHLDALLWSKTLLELPDAVILDTETTGLIEGPLRNENAEIVEFAIIDMKGTVLYNKRFKPRFEIPVIVIGIHGITNEAVKNSPSFANEYAKILKILHGKIIVAYNSRFDQKIIGNTCRLHELAQIDGVTWECAMWAYKGYQESPRFLKLPNGKHSALADCNATLKLIRQMSKAEAVPI